MLVSSEMPKLILSIPKPRLISSFCIFHPKNTHSCRPDQGQSRDDAMLCISSWATVCAPLLTLTALGWVSRADLSLFCSVWYRRSKEPERLSGPACNTFLLLVNKHLWHGREGHSPVIPYHLDMFNTLFKINILFCFAFSETPCIPP